MATANLIQFGNPFSELWGGVDKNNGIGITATDLPTQNDGISMAMTATMTDTITHIGYRQGTTTGTPAAGSYTITLQTLTTGGLPSGTNVGSTTSTTFTPSSANDAKWVWVSLGANTYSLTQGQEFAIVLQRTAATDASNKITSNPGLTPFGRRAWPSCITAAAGVWTKTTGTFPMMGMKSASSVYGRPWSLILQSTAGPSFGSTTEIGMVFTVPTNYCSTYKLRGISALIATPTTSATNDFVVTLYSSPASSPARVDQSIAMITDRFVVFNQSYINLTTYFTSSTVLTAGTQYAIGLATTTGSDANLYCMEVTSAADFDAHEFQQQTAFTTRTASSYAAIKTGTATGNFSNTTTRRPFMDLILDDLTAPASGGGMRLAGHGGLAA